MTPQRLSPDDAAALVGARDEPGIGLGSGRPPELLAALGRRDDRQELLAAAAPASKGRSPVPTA